MPRYMVERTFPGGLQIPVSPDGVQACLTVVDHNAEVGVTWVHSYVTQDKTKTFYIYDGPGEEAIPCAATRNACCGRSGRNGPETDQRTDNDVGGNGLLPISSPLTSGQTTGWCFPG